LTQDIKDPLLTLNGHTKRITAINFHPTANNILLSTSADYTGRIWDVTKGESALELAGHGDVLLGAEWSVGGQLLTACQDAKYRLYDIRTGKDPVVTQVAHEGTKGFHVSWLGNSAAATDAKKARPQFFATVGFSKSSERQLAIWGPSRTCCLNEEQHVTFGIYSLRYAQAQSASNSASCGCFFVFSPALL
jgi:coronin-1B/1C/6